MFENSLTIYLNDFHICYCFRTYFSTYKEISLAKDLGLKYLYLGPSYERHAKYKSSFPGFEFWTGREWCTDEEKYFYLLYQDEKINSIEALVDSYNSFFKHFSI